MSDSATNATSTAGAPRPERDFVSMLRSPRSAEVMHVDGDNLVSAGGAERYQVSCTGIPLFAREFLSDAGRFQQSHYDGMVAKYVENLDYPHTQEYMAYLDRQFLAALPVGSLGAVAELCCGRGEAARLLDGRMERCIGVDVSVEMLEIARRDLPGERFFFAQGDATMLPLREQAHGVDLGRLPADKRRLLIYDQLNPHFAKYYTRAEAVELISQAPFDVEVHHRRGYSWVVIGTKPAERS